MLAPLAFNVVLLPEQIVTLEPALTVGSGFTLTVTVALFAHPIELVPVTVYTVNDVGFAFTLLPVVADKVPPGYHV